MEKPYDMERVELPAHNVIDLQRPHSAFQTYTKENSIYLKIDMFKKTKNTSFILCVDKMNLEKLQESIEEVGEEEFRYFSYTDANNHIRLYIDEYDLVTIRIVDNVHEL